jgi:hypothetical protein
VAVDAEAIVVADVDASGDVVSEWPDADTDAASTCPADAAGIPAGTAIAV